MGRQPRKISESGFYHAMLRGINRQNIFDEAGDYSFFLDMLGKVKKALGFDIYAYCLMTNHGHLLIREKCPGDLTNIMQRLLTRYAHYYNKKYERCGTLFGQRYASEPVTTGAVPILSHPSIWPARSITIWQSSTGCLG